MTAPPDDPKAGFSRLFGEMESDAERTKDPFGGDLGDRSGRGRVRASLVRLRRLRAQTGAEGLTPAGTRTLLDEVVRSLEALVEMVEPRDPDPAQSEGEPDPDTTGDAPAG
jgi:hypothetical protein